MLPVVETAPRSRVDPFPVLRIHLIALRWKIPSHVWGGRIGLPIGAITPYALTKAASAKPKKLKSNFDLVIAVRYDAVLPFRADRSTCCRRNFTIRTGSMISIHRRVQSRYAPHPHRIPTFCAAIAPVPMRNTDKRGDVASRIKRRYPMILDRRNPGTKSAITARQNAGNVSAHKNKLAMRLRTTILITRKHHSAPQPVHRSTCCGRNQAISASDK